MLEIAGHQRQQEQQTKTRRISPLSLPQPQSTRSHGCVMYHADMRALHLVTAAILHTLAQGSPSHRRQAHLPTSQHQYTLHPRHRSAWTREGLPC